ncbi:CRISPR-associated endonuclease Cas3'', partial [Thermoactinospora rubra]|uniref:CRISPR-associated endonuclease Cas3'' n=1 Tax=Thermoactinospora rubra TaxID=1088767 RepID=UPI000A100A74
MVCHLLDAVAAVETLWDDYLAVGLRKAIAAELGVSEVQARALLAYWAGLHDIGKVISCFQSGHTESFLQLTGYPERRGEKKTHDFAVHAWLARILAADNARLSPRSCAFQVAQLLGGHHGKFYSYDFRTAQNPLAFVPELGDGRWEEQRRAIVTVVHRLAGSPELPGELSGAGAALASGLVILADWLVSQDHFLRGRLAHGLPERGGLESLAKHLDATRAVMPAVLEEAGLSRPEFQRGGFQDDFPQITEPNGLQRSISEPFSSSRDLVVLQDG